MARNKRIAPPKIGLAANIPARNATVPTEVEPIRQDPKTDVVFGKPSEPPFVRMSDVVTNPNLPEKVITVTNPSKPFPEPPAPITSEETEPDPWTGEEITSEGIYMNPPEPDLNKPFFVGDSTGVEITTWEMSEEERAELEHYKKTAAYVFGQVDDLERVDPGGIYFEQNGPVLISRTEAMARAGIVRLPKIGSMVLYYPFGSTPNGDPLPPIPAVVVRVNESGSVDLSCFEYTRMVFRPTIYLCGEAELREGKFTFID